MQGFYFALLQCSHTQAFTVRFAPPMQLYHPRRDAAQASTAAYYNKVYKKSSDHAIPVGQSSGMDAAGGAEQLTATAVSLFGLSPDS